LKWGFDYSRPIGPVTAPSQRGGALGQLRRVLPPGAARAPGRPAGAPAAGLDGGPGSGPDGGTPEGAPAPGPDGGGAQAAGPPPGGFGGGPPGGFAGRGPGGGGGGRGGRGGGQDGRLRITVFHTIFFDNQYLVRAGGPLLDFLNGASLGGLGGQPRHEIQAQVNIAERGYGAELSADWKSGTSVHGPPGAGGDLDFSGIVKVNARLFADLSQRKTLMDHAPWLKGSRITLSVSNIFDQRIAVRDANGVTPLSFQPAYIDPLGRTWRIGFRKLFS
jgi:hypothetical protein